MVLNINPALPNNIMVLDRHDTMDGYAQQYGLDLVRHYERDGLIYIPHVPLGCDLPFLQQITFPKQYKKIGYINKIHESPLLFQNGQFSMNPKHPLMPLNMDTLAMLYLQQQIALCFNGLTELLLRLFSCYKSLQIFNITWRFTETFDEGMHLDIFNGGAVPYTAKSRQYHRVKIFINLDSMPRHWRTSLSYAEVLQRYRHELPDEMPDDMNVMSAVLDKLGVLTRLPYHDIAYPALSAVIGNGETLTHQVVYGRRVLAAEFFCHASDMLQPEYHSHTRLPLWLREQGYSVTSDYDRIVQQYSHMKGALEKVIETQIAQGASYYGKDGKTQ